MKLTAESPLQALRGVHLLRIATQVQMIALLHTLDDWLILHPKVRQVRASDNRSTSSL